METEGRMEVPSIKDEGRTTSERLAQGDRAHVGAAFRWDRHRPEGLRYRLTWNDGRGPQRQDRQVPLA